MLAKKYFSKDFIYKTIFNFSFDKLKTSKNFRIFFLNIFQ